MLSLYKPVRIKSFLWFYFLVFALLLAVTAAGSRVITVMSETTPLKNRCCIIIDAGHGGEDGGTTSCSGVLESTINLEISHRLNDLLCLLGYDTYMLRTTHEAVSTQGNTIAARKLADLKQRVKIINERNNAIVVSVHQNYFSDSRYSGAQVFYPKTNGSDALAKQMQSALVSALNPDSNRQAKKVSGVYLMEHIQCTGILIECGFLSNVEEEGKLLSPEYQKDLCSVIASTLSLYLDR